MASGKSFRALYDDAVRSWSAGNHAGAEPLLREVLALRPRHPEALHLLGIWCAQTGRLEEAAGLLEQAVSLKPYFVEAQGNLGAVLVAQRRSVEAEEVLRRVVTLKPDYAAGHNNLGKALQQQGRLEEALASFRRAMEVRPGFAEAAYQMAAVLAQQGDMDGAIGEMRKALAMDPGFIEAKNGLANLLRDVGRSGDALALYREILAREPEHVAAHSNILTVMNAMPGLTPGDIFRAHREWSAAHTPGKSGERSHDNDRNPERRLRVGYVSPDLYRHSVASFLEPVLEAHDRGAVEVFAYADMLRTDAVTARLMKLADTWRDITALSDGHMAELVERDRIDILVDLAGHTVNNRLPAFARRPAPVQVTWLGYPNTTGMGAMDYRLTDARADPVGEADRVHAEKLVRLPETFLCFRAPEEAPAVGGLPALGGGGIRFGSFNAASKINGPLLALWGRVLAAVPGSRMLVKAKYVRSAENRRRILDAFAAEGVAADRVELLDFAASPAEHLAMYGRVDVALDTFPYHGTTTTCEALWMGVPVVALAGDRHVSRVGVSLLTSVGLMEGIARTEEEYVERAAAWARDLAGLGKLRSGLRARMGRSPLMDAAGFSRNLEGAYRAMWRTWCAG